MQSSRTGLSVPRFPLSHWVSRCRGWGTLERAWPEVAHVVDFVALEQRRDPAAVLRTRRDLQDQVTVAERLVVDLQGLLVVAEPLQGSHNAAAQPVVAAVLIQMRAPCSPQRISTAAMSTPADRRSAEMAGICDLSVSKPTTW